MTRPFPINVAILLEVKLVSNKCRTVDVVGLFVGAVLIADGNGANGGKRNMNGCVCMSVCVCLCF